MTNLAANFNQIQEFAKGYGLPAEKQRAVAREYLQSKIISLIYSDKISKNIFFVGGTALRLLYGLDRFSEDLDFDAPKVPRSQIKQLITNISANLKKEDFKHTFYTNFKKDKDYFEFRFENLLFRDEKLVIKLDFEPFWQKQARELVFLSRYGFLANVVTKSKDQFLVEKLVAFLNRKQTEGRDVYDIVWLYSQRAKPEVKFAKDNGFEVKKLISDARKKFANENKELLKTSLKPFLLKEAEINKIDFFNQVVT